MVRKFDHGHLDRLLDQEVKRPFTRTTTAEQYRIDAIMAVRVTKHQLTIIGGHELRIIGG